MEMLEKRPVADFTDQLGAIFAELLATDWEPPFVWTCASWNGSIIGGTCDWYEDDRLDAGFTVEHSAEAGFELPVALTVINREGDVRVWRIEEGRRREVLQ